VRGNLPDLVEEKGSSVGLQEATVVTLDGAGERTPLVPEELGLENGLRQGRAVDRYEGSVGPLGGSVDGPRDQLLAGARLAEQEHRRHRRRGLHHGVHEAAPGQRLADDRLVPLGLELSTQRAVLAHQVALLERLAHGAHHLGALERLGHEVVRPVPHGIDRVLDGAVGGHEDGLGLGGNAAAGLEEIEPRHPGHHQIGQQHRHGLAP